MANALSDLGLPQADPDYMAGGEEGDGTDLWGVAAYCEPQEPQNGIWDDPPQLASLLAKEEKEEQVALDAEADELGNNVELLGEPEYNTGWLNREPPAWFTWADLLADENTGCDWDGLPVVDKVVPDADDLQPTGVRGVQHALHRLNRRKPYGGYDGGHGRPDNFRRKRQRVTRPRQAAAKAKEMAIAA